MTDDSLSEMPEFSKPSESEPIVIIPDQAPAVATKPKCQAQNKQGNPCRVPPLKGEKYCLGHAKGLAPELSSKWSRVGGGLQKASRSIRTKIHANTYSKDDLLAYLSSRLDLVKERFGGMCNVEVEEMICNIVRTMAVVYKLDQPDAGKDAIGWRAKGAV